MKTKTQAALASAMIKTLLKKAYPEIKFSVRSENFAGGDSVSISYINGVPSDRVEDLVKKFQYGHFDGMTDCYEFSNRVDGLPQAKYVQVSRSISPEERQKIKTRIAQSYGMINENDEQEWMAKMNMWSDMAIWREASKLTI